MGQVGHGGVDRAFSSEAPGPGFERPATPSKKPHFFTRSQVTELSAWSLSCIGVDTGFKPPKNQSCIML